MSSKENDRKKKLCFVTIGATANFDALIRATLSETFLQALQHHRYTDLLLQYGNDDSGMHKAKISECAKVLGKDKLNVTGFGFNKQGLGQEMRQAKGDANSLEGVVISHAGSGSILAALRLAVPVIVVPNTELLDNHQLELAEELARQGYVIHGRLDDLPAALEDAERLRQEQHAWPPKSKHGNASRGGLTSVMDDEMGFVD